MTCFLVANHSLLSSACFWIRLVIVIWNPLSIWDHFIHTYQFSLSIKRSRETNATFPMLPSSAHKLRILRTKNRSCISRDTHWTHICASFGGNIYSTQTDSYLTTTLSSPSEKSYQKIMTVMPPTQPHYLFWSYVCRIPLEFGPSPDRLTNTFHLNIIHLNNSNQPGNAAGFGYHSSIVPGHTLAFRCVPSRASGGCLTSPGSIGRSIGPRIGLLCGPIRFK